jgi:hypothetical protein
MNAPALYFVGDSHIGSVKKAVDLIRSAPDGASIPPSVRIYYSTTNWHADLPWHNFDANGFLLRPRYIPEVPHWHGLPADTLDAMTRKPFLCLVGLQLHGHGLLDVFMPGGMLGDYRIDPRPFGTHTPRIPIIASNTGFFGSAFEQSGSHCYHGFISSSCLFQIYLDSLTKLLDHAARLARSGCYEHVFWIPAPVIPFSSASVRMGTDYLETRQLSGHLSVYELALKSIGPFLETLSSDLTILPPCLGVQIDDYGCSADLYKTEFLGDAHVHPSYYYESLAFVLKRSGLSSRIVGFR